LVKSRICLGQLLVKCRGRRPAGAQRRQQLAREQARADRLEAELREARRPLPVPRDESATPAETTEGTDPHPAGGKLRRAYSVAQVGGVDGSDSTIGGVDSRETLSPAAPLLHPHLSSHRVVLKACTSR
jgi:hypothetical protein